MKPEKSQTRSVRWAPEEIELIERVAEKRSMTFSQLVRKAALDDVTKVGKVRR